MSEGISKPRNNACDESTVSLDSVNAAYSRWAPVYDFVFSGPLYFGRRAAVREANRLGGKVLEVGVGTGLSLPDYRRDIQITGIDLSQDMLARARERVRRKKLSNVEALRAMDAAELDLPDASFDVAAIMYVMTVVPDPAAVFRELERVVRPGGKVIVVNHFAAESGIRAWGERVLARWGDYLGWDPVFPKERLFAATRMKCISEVPVPPFGLFTKFVFERPKDGLPA
ncbi:methyltransferase domain-containing protein [Stappia sp. GBMRC 2046]|uniref:Methyltransferase domain-containing protein n=1 Tax=Stappia sediminis TaxID=2692190 RepID=A0A7X3J0I2_9HYPH|nr:methyltransferase domain-containing protein [Stappia sediminis]MXN63285.1 methyltransferase domain-containing protein [Stappia sediminis]